MRSGLGPLEPSPATETVALQPAEAYAPPPMGPRSSLAPLYVPRERRLWTAALAAALLVCAASHKALYVNDTNYQNADRALTTQTEQLTGRNQNLQTQLTTT